MALKAILSAILLCLGLVWAADLEQELEGGVDPKAVASYFVDASLGYVLAINVAENGDVYIHMNAPSSSSYMGVGFGDSMTNTRMILVWISDDGHHLTTSCRLATGHSEPVYDPYCKVEDVATDGYAPFHNTLSPDGILIAHSVCRNCSTWPGGSLDLNSKAQPFIYALGPNRTIEDRDNNATSLRLHEKYGSFNLDMTVATNYTGDYGRVPAPQDPGLQKGHGFWAFANYFSSSVYAQGKLVNWAASAHAVCMCAAFLIIFPAGAMSLRLTRRATIHAGAQLIGVAFVFAGFGLAVYVSSLFNKSKHYNSAHQIIGLLVFAGVLVQVGLGLTHHLLFLRSGSPTPLGKIHRYLGISTMAVAVINGGLGFNFAQNSYTAYVIIVAIAAAIFGSITIMLLRHSRRTVYRPEKEPFADANYGMEPPAEYEMEPQTPFATMGHVATPRTPYFAAHAPEGWNDDPEDYRSWLTRQNTNANESLYTDTPASESRENPFKSKWEAVRVD